MPMYEYPVVLPRVILDLGRVSQVRKFAELGLPHGAPSHTGRPPTQVSRLGVAKMKNRSGLCFLEFTPGVNAAKHSLDLF